MDVMRLLFGARPTNAHRNGRIVITRPPANVEWRRVRPRDDSAPVRAWVAEADCVIPTAHGKLRAKGGEDVIILHDEDEHSVVRLDIFERTYEPIGGGLYRKRDDVVLRCFTLDNPAIVQTLEGPQQAEPGDWVMQGVTGELWPVARAKALEKYQPA